MLSRTGGLDKVSHTTAEAADTEHAAGKTSPQSPRMSAEEGPLAGLARRRSSSQSAPASRRNSLEAAQASRDAAERPTVSVVGFPSDTSLESALKHPIDPPHPYRVTGHVGYSLDGGKTIFGFGPSVPEGVNAADTIARLLKKETFPGQVTDDTAVFRSVAENPQHPKSTASTRQYVYKHEMVVSPQQYAAIKAVHDSRPLGEAMPEVRYSFPYPNTSAFNCATYPSDLGIDIPHPRGSLVRYIPKLAEKGEMWQPH